MLAIRTFSALAGAGGAAKASGAAGTAASKAVAKKLDDMLFQMAQDGLIKSGGVIDPKTGKPLLNLNELAQQTGGKTDLKEATGEFFGQALAKQLMPEAHYLGGATGSGQKGIDGIYQLKGADGQDHYVFVENKYNKSRQGNSKDGLQGSGSWLLGSDRIKNVVGDEVAPDVRAAIRAGRTDSLLIRTLPDGRTQVKLLDARGKPQPLSNANIDLVNRIANMNRGTQP